MWLKGSTSHLRNLNKTLCNIFSTCSASNTVNNRLCRRHTLSTSCMTIHGTQQADDCYAWQMYRKKAGDFPANKRHRTNAGLMLGQRRRRWPNIKTALVQYLVFAGWSCSVQTCSLYIFRAQLTLTFCRWFVGHAQLNSYNTFITTLLRC